VPLIAGLLLGADALIGLEIVDLFEQFGADGADLLVRLALLPNIAFGVEDGVDVQGRRRRLASQLPETVDQLLLEVVGQVVLFAEEDDVALRDCDALARC